MKDKPYKYCSTFHRQCPKVKKNGMCRKKDKENCVESERMMKLFQNVTYGSHF